MGATEGPILIIAGSTNDILPPQKERVEPSSPTPSDDLKVGLALDISIFCEKNFTSTDSSKNQRGQAFSPAL